jgi:hypothetical protein
MANSWHGVHSFSLMRADQDFETAPDYPEPLFLTFSSLTLAAMNTTRARPFAALKLATLTSILLAEAVGFAAGGSRLVPAPLFRDPVFDGAADPTLVYNRAEKCWWMLYTNRRATVVEAKGLAWVHGTDLGIASTPDNGVTWKYRGTAKGLEFEPGRNTFWAPEIVFHEGLYHAFISYVRGVPETWDGSRDILHYTSKNLVDWKYEASIIPGAIDACVHRLPDGRWRMWFKNEQHKYTGTVADSKDLYVWEPCKSAMPDPDPGQGEGPDVVFWHGYFWMLKDTWKGQGVYRSPDAETWMRSGTILEQPGKRPGDHGLGQHAGLLVQDEGHAYIFYFVHQGGDELHNRRTWLQAAELKFDSTGKTLACDRDAAFEIHLTEPAPEYQPEHPPKLSQTAHE